jgi:pyruvate formate lyase activating enzyme
MRLGGLQPCTLQDFPGKVAAVIFVRGCNLRCPYCHNPQLLSPSSDGQEMSETDFFSFLSSRRGKLSGVVVSGGEPTLQSDLPQFLAKVRGMGFAVKLDTNGTDPSMLALLLTGNLVDYVAMDLKDLPEAYPEWLGQADPQKIRTSLALLRASRISHELRTTVASPRISLSRLETMAKLVAGSRWFLQEASPGNTLEEGWKQVPAALLDVWCSRLREGGTQSCVRARTLLASEHLFSEGTLS